MSDYGLNQHDTYDFYRLDVDDGLDMDDFNFGVEHGVLWPTCVHCGNVVRTRKLFELPWHQECEDSYVAAVNKRETRKLACIYALFMTGSVALLSYVIMNSTGGGIP